MSKHLYIHWPFCKSKCNYCDFTAFAKHELFIKQYHDALCDEIRSYQSTEKVKTIFLGGGTPSLYPLELLKELFLLINKNFDLSEVKEISIEVNPGDVTHEMLKVWKELGINRLSIGVQVLDDKVLASLNRTQTCEEVYSLMDKVFNYFDNVSIDLILGLPGITNDAWLKTLEKVTSWPITHLSTYMLMVKENTSLYFKVKSKALKILKDDTLIKRYENTVKFLESKGLLQYEISNFSLDGYQSLHNKAYWDRVPYKGFGVGASSFNGKERFTNSRNLMEYLTATGVHEIKEFLSESQHQMETLMLTLRKSSGLDLHTMLYLLNDGENSNHVLGRLDMLMKQDLVRMREGHITLTLKGMALENEVVLSLLSD